MLLAFLGFKLPIWLLLCKLFFYNFFKSKIKKIKKIKLPYNFVPDSIKHLKNILSNLHVFKTKRYMSLLLDFIIPRSLLWMLATFHVNLLEAVSSKLGPGATVIWNQHPIPPFLSQIYRALSLYQIKYCKLDYYINDLFLLKFIDLFLWQTILIVLTCLMTIQYWLLGCTVWKFSRFFFYYYIREIYHIYTSITHGIYS